MEKMWYLFKKYTMWKIKDILILIMIHYR
jgi:hypothetical protein